jgi:hypothetical protein
MKQFESHGVTFFHNGDFSGDVHMQKERGPGFVVPGAALKALFHELAQTNLEKAKAALADAHAKVKASKN